MMKRTVPALLVAPALWATPVQSETADFSANRFMPGCREPVRVPTRNFEETYDAGFVNGRCVGFVTGIAFASPSICPPPEATVSQLVRVVVKYVDERPQRAHESFSLLTQEALVSAWPCKR